jgi:septum formation inhibitor MinC
LEKTKQWSWSLMGPATKTDCAGDGQQQFFQLTDRPTDRKQIQKQYMGPAEPENKNDFAVDDQQKFIKQTIQTGTEMVHEKSVILTS